MSNSSNKLVTILALLLLGAVAPLALADDAEALQRLESVMSELDTLQANFSQTVLDANLEPVRESRGSLLVSRPGKFRWDYTKPFEQTIVADGVNLWTYDPDLEQATVKPLETTLASSPASLLTGSKPIGDEFEVKEIGAAGELYWIELVPRVQDTDFEQVRVALHEGELDTMELVDNLGQTTRIRFTGVKRNVELPAGSFDFSPPEGADLIGEPLQADDGDAGDPARD